MNPCRYSCIALLTLLFLSVSPPGQTADIAGDPRERAASALEQSLKTDPNNPELWVHLGFAYRKLGQIDQAQSAFEKATHLNPQNTEAFYMLGLIYESKHETQAAQKAWQSYLLAEKDVEKRAVAEKHLHHLSQ